MASKVAPKKKDSVKDVQIAKRAFFSALFDLSWRLLSAMLLPIFVGLFIDNQADTDIFALLGFILGMVLGVLVIRSVIKKMTEEAKKK